MDILFVFLIGILTGLSACFLGVGGGIIIVPLLPLIFEIKPTEVVGTSLLTVFLIVFSNTLFFHRQKLVQWKTVLFFGFFTSLGSYLAGCLTAFVNPLLMEGAFAFVICILALIFLSEPSSKDKAVSKLKSKEEREEKKQKKRRKNVLKPLLWSLGSLIIGGASGFTGTGSGAVLASLLIHFKKINKKKVVPVTNAIAMLTSLFGAIAFLQSTHSKTDVYLFNTWNIGVIHLDIFIILSLGALPTTLIGRPFQHRMPSTLRKRCLAILLFTLGLKVFVSFLFDLRS